MANINIHLIIIFKYGCGLGSKLRLALLCKRCANRLRFVDVPHWLMQSCGVVLSCILKEHIRNMKAIPYVVQYE